MDGNDTLRVAVVGAGPAGLYAAESLLKAADSASVDVFDRLPTPYGLVRYGVAPDHQKMKVVTKLYERTLRDPRVRYLGNVAYGRDVHLADLRRHYSAIVFAVGASTDRRLGIPGEDLAGSVPATDFVAWYNGHPDACDLPFAELLATAREVVVIGNGNVAIDVTRVLAKSVAELSATDIADHALSALEGSAVRTVTMIGRRGPAEAKFTTKELRELGELENADVLVASEDLELTAESAAAAAADMTTAKNVDVLREFALQTPAGKPRTVALRFQLMPVALLGSSRVEGVEVERTRLVSTDDGRVTAVGTGERETLPAQLVLRSVGYTGVAVPELPFDERRGVIPNDAGRVTGVDGSPLYGIYVAGWIKRGASGVIGTNKADAMETVRSLLDDHASGRLVPTGSPDDVSPEAVDRTLAERGVKPFDAARWFALDAFEVAAGEGAGRPRVKRVRLEEMLADD